DNKKRKGNHWRRQRVECGVMLRLHDRRGRGGADHARRQVRQGHDHRGWQPHACVVVPRLQPLPRRAPPAHTDGRQPLPAPGAVQHALRPAAGAPAGRGCAAGHGKQGGV
ncbi:hypothetical protein FOA52_010921, partial [Chlamydomonas sp. UWO 241]